MCLNETCSTVRIGKNLYDAYPIQNGLSQRHVLYPLLFTFSSEHVIPKVQECQEGLQLNGIYERLSCVNGVYIPGEAINTIKTNTVLLLKAGKDTGLEINAQKGKYMLTSRQQNARKLMI
jgi:hypothetical protein